MQLKKWNECYKKNIKIKFKKIIYLEAKVVIYFRHISSIHLYQTEDYMYLQSEINSETWFDYGKNIPYESYFIDRFV